jgi:mannan endo-1,4-beta-mannosidase
MKSIAQRQFAPVNPEATEKTVKLYLFLQELPGAFILSGQHNFVGKGSEYSHQLEKLTGKKAVVWGSDFSFKVKGEDATRYQHAGPANLPLYPWEQLEALPDFSREEAVLHALKYKPELNYLDISLEAARESTVREAIESHREGHIITLMWHASFPGQGDHCEGSSIWTLDKRPSPEQWKELVTEGTDLNRLWKTEADTIAAYLKELRDAGVPVLWRPYHEMNGIWFWWGSQREENGFKRLWIMMFEYFTGHHGLNNLIWVWNANAPRDIPGDEAWPYGDFFPGIEYVDVLAADVYHNDYRQSHHDQLVELGQGKPIALGEVGDLPTLDILEQQDAWTWFMPWAWVLFLANEEELIKEIYRSERVLTLDKLETDRLGNVRIRG